MKLTVKALCNDTVGTLVSHSYINPSTRVAVILGTGTNAAYVEKIGNMGKWQRQLGSPGKATIKSGEMVINTEWGAFDNKKNIIPRTQYDDLLDEASSVPCMQIFEKMVSGMYLGEIVRLALLDVFERTSRVNEIASLANKFKQAVGPYKFETAFMSRIER